MSKEEAFDEALNDMLDRELFDLKEKLIRAIKKRNGHKLQGRLEAVKGQIRIRGFAVEASK